jgi:hypothetical protein
MKLLLPICFMACWIQAFSWGFYGHKKINETAVYTIPKPLFGFYKANVEYLVKHATDADNRRYIVEEEACRHYLDGDHYEHHVPLDTIPRFYKDACLKYTEDSVLAHGIVPWHIQAMMYRLTEAFKLKDIAKILKYSADLGHYIGDCHVPLHATSNYNGQKTGQYGIHALWESRLPELFNADYDLFTGLALYQEHPVTATWNAFEQSFGLVDSVLKTERAVSWKFTDDLKYAFETKGNATVKVYSREFCSAYHKALGNMVEERMRASIIMLGSFWYTCWVNAGQPELPNMPMEETSDDEQKKADELKGKAKILGREEE